MDRVDQITALVVIILLLGCLFAKQCITDTRLDKLEGNKPKTQEISMSSRSKLNWKWKDGEEYREAILGLWPVDGVRFQLSLYPTCYRRGPWRLLVEVCGGPHHRKWGCFDDQDQPMRYYHSEENALDEAQRLADVLWTDRKKHDEGTQAEQEEPGHEPSLPH